MTTVWEDAASRPRCPSCRTTMRWWAEHPSGCRLADRKLRQLDQLVGVLVALGLTSAEFGLWTLAVSLGFE